MLLLAYSSLSSYPFSDGDLITLLMNSRANNRRDGVTGLLLHDSGRFLQILEGEDEVVRRRYDRIAADPRHRELVVLSEQHEEERQFPQWSMGYNHLGDPLIKSIPGFTDFFGGTQAQQATSVSALLERFRQKEPLTGVGEQL